MFIVTINLKYNKYKSINNINLKYNLLLNKYSTVTCFFLFSQFPHPYWCCLTQYCFQLHECWLCFPKDSCLVHCRGLFNIWPMSYSVHTSKILLWTGLLTSLLILTLFTSAIFLCHLTTLQHISEFIWKGEERELSSFYDWNTEMHHVINLRLLWVTRNLFLEYLVLQFVVPFLASSTAAAGILQFGI